MVKSWKKVESEQILHTPVFRLRQEKRISPRTGMELPVFVLETGMWINVLPITPQNEVVLVRQFRFGIEQVTLEIPGGLVDPGEDPKDAARRELNEETGYDSEEISLLGEVRPNPAIQDTTCYVYLARDVHPVYAQSLDDGEDIHIETVPFDRIPQLVRTGAIDHSLVLNAFYYYDLRQQQEHD